MGVLIPSLLRRVILQGAPSEPYQDKVRILYLTCLHFFLFRLCHKSINGSPACEN